MKVITSFLHCHWFHDLESEPIEMWYELDEQRYTIRQIECFRDGRLKAMSEQLNSECLADLPCPRVDEINGSDEFAATKITALEFEAVWMKALLHDSELSG